MLHKVHFIKSDLHYRFLKKNSKILTKEKKIQAQKRRIEIPMLSTYSIAVSTITTRLNNNY